MNRSTAKWILSTVQCRQCYSRVPESEVLNDMLCRACHQVTIIFPNGERNRARRGHEFIPGSLLAGIPGLYETEDTLLADKMLHVLTSSVAATGTSPSLTTRWDSPLVTQTSARASPNGDISTSSRWRRPSFRSCSSSSGSFTSRRTRPREQRPSNLYARLFPIVILFLTKILVGEILSTCLAWLLSPTPRLPRLP